MSGQGDGRGRLSRVLGVRTASEGDSVTTLELFFDLVFVFAFTQVTFLMAHGEPPASVAQGVVVLGLLWWSWSSFAWLGNQAHANEGLVRTALIIAAAVFVLSLTIPEAFHDLEGGLYAPLVFACCYAVIRLVHLSTYLIAAGKDAALRRQVLLSLSASAVPSIVLLIVGALLDEQWRLIVWTAAIVVDLLAIYVTSSIGGSWRVQSVAHFTERHRLVVILALGESIVAIGVGVSLDAITASIVIGSLLAIGLSVALWWAYFQRIAEDAEHLLERADGVARAKLASDGYTYLHLPIILGVILTALGIEEVMGHLGEDHLDWFGAAALGAGVALFLAATAAFWLRMSRRILAVRFISAVVIAAAIPLWSALPGLWALAGVLALVTILIAVESLRWGAQHD
ncbi:Low temperature requirement protein LtrA [Microbacterium sp. cf046]|uniref:low temperature requirement protein A n=1 Tax=Microbacterium sp. cf046 TaxID=1761803 RepID=UPI0008EBF35F|nr:low temperature requirement protein A [Microbacterium sp. cf046]SFR87083.1 Low temperature requirement protein LtrA [Microbacterium sp. cf046]